MKIPTLGAIMIVKNEEKNLGGILSDIRGVVDEICVVDTGSSDGTVALAESFGARIGHFPWVNDFSAARNCSIEMACSDYLLWLDADDRIDEEDRKGLIALKSRLRPQKDRVYMLRLLNSGEGGADSISYQTRILPNADGVRFEGRIHEQVLPDTLKRCGLSTETVNVTVRHTGYHDPADRPAKARRNLEILVQELDEGKDTATQHFFIAMAHIGLGDYEQCLASFEKARRKHTDENWYHISFIIATDCLLDLDRIDDAMREILRGASLFPDSSLMHYYLGNVLMQTERFEEAAEAYRKASSLPLRIDAYPTPPDLGTIILVQYGKALEKSGRVDEAIAVYTRLIDEGVRKSDLYYAMGIALLQKGQVAGALLKLEQARELTREFDPALWLTLARVHLFLGHHADAHSIYRESLPQLPGDSGAAIGLAQTSVAMDDVESLLAALESLMEGLGMDPDRVLDTPEEIAALCAEVGKCLHASGEPDHAARMGETALVIDPSSTGALLLLADVCIAAGRKADAAGHLEKALKAGAPLPAVEERMARMA
jgi:tetratricopeptide (TPR) repeat protein